MANTLSVLRLTDVIWRLLLAVALGGTIGLEREFKRRPTGLRTHMLICLGAAVTTLTSQYLMLNMHYYTDISRLGAQVISGIGFIGTGTIIVSRRSRIRGLTTVAGLWAAAIIGMAVGAGFYLAGVVTTVLIMFIETVFSVLEHKMAKNTREYNLMLEYRSKESLGRIFDIYRTLNVNVQHVQITHKEKSNTDCEFAIFFLKLSRKHKIEQLMQALSNENDIVSIKML